MLPSLASPMTIKRIHREVADVSKEDLGQITLAPSEDNIFLWKATIPGPQGSVYEGGVYTVDINLASDYPFSAPKVTFTTRIYHMNISDRGSICMDILKNNWSPALSLYKVVLSLSSLLTDPNPHDPLVPSIATQYMRNREQHDSTARTWTKLYAQSPVEEPKVPAPKPKGKGKNTARTTDGCHGSPAPNDLGVGGSRRSARNQREPIEIVDSGDEQDGSQGGTDARTAKGKSKKRKHEGPTGGTRSGSGSAGTSSDNTVVELAVELNESLSVQQRKRAKKTPDPGNRRGRRDTGDQTRWRMDDVIVIED